MDTRRPEPIYEAIADELIRSVEKLRQIRESKVKIAYLASNHEMKKNGRAVLGQCEKVAEKYKWAIPYDFTITVFLPNVERLTEKQLQILLYHELLHVGVDQDGNEERYSIVPHDIEDFEAIILEYGLDWSSDEQTGEAEGSRRRDSRADEPGEQPELCGAGEAIPRDLEGDRGDRRSGRR